MMKLLQKYDILGHPLGWSHHKRGFSHVTACGGFFSILSFTIITVFVVLRIPLLGDGAFDIVPNESDSGVTYSVFGNLLPELAGLLVVGRYILDSLLMPLNISQHRIDMIEKLLLGKTGKEGSLLPKDSSLAQIFSFGCCRAFTCCACFACSCANCFSCFACDCAQLFSCKCAKFFSCFSCKGCCPTVNCSCDNFCKGISKCC